MPTPHLSIGDLLKSEADVNSRLSVPADKNTVAGDFVVYPLRGAPVVALTDAHNGEVLVQPHNCVIDLHHINEAQISILTTDDGAGGSRAMTVDDLKQQGDAYGIVYIGEPAPEPATPNVGV